MNRGFYAVSVLLFLGCAGLGRLGMVSPSPQPGVEAVVTEAGGPAVRKPGFSPHGTAGKSVTDEPGPGSHSYTTLALRGWERWLWEMPAASFAEEVRNLLARDGRGSRVRRMLTVWAERDRAGFLEWERSQDEARSHVGEEVMVGDIKYLALAKSDPDAAWELSRQYGNSQNAAWAIRAIFQADEDQGVEILRKHRREIGLLNNWHGVMREINPFKLRPLLDEGWGASFREQYLDGAAGYYSKRPAETDKAKEWLNSLSVPDRESLVGPKNFWKSIFWSRALQEAWQVPEEKTPAEGGKASPQ